MKKLRLILSLAAALALSILFAVFAFADTQGIYTYTVTNGEAAITAISPTEAAPILIPETLGGVPVTSISGNALDASAVNVPELHFPASLTVISTRRVFMSARIAAITVDEANPAFSAENGVLYNKDQTTLLACPQYTSLESLTVPETVTAIGYGAFANQKNLKRVVLPEGLTTIGEQAFIFNGSTEELVMPDSVTTLRDNCFAYMSALRSLTLPAGITRLPGGCISDCTALEKLEILAPIDTLEYGPIDNLTALKTLILPGSVTTVTANTFRNSAALERILFAGSVDDWNAVTVESDNTPFLIAAVQTDYPAETYHALTIRENAGVLEIAGEEALPDTDRYDYHPWDDDAGTTHTLVISGGIPSIGGCAFADFSALSDVIVRAPSVWISDAAFTDCTALSSVFLFGATGCAADPFPGCGTWINVFSESPVALSSPDLHHVTVSYADGTLTYAGLVRQDAYDFFDAISVFASVYGEIDRLRVERLQFDGFSVFATDPESGERRPVTGDLENAELTAWLKNDTGYASVTFNALTAGISDGSITDFYLSFRDEAHPEETKTEFNIVERIGEFFQKLLRAIITLLNRLLRFFGG